SRSYALYFSHLNLRFSYVYNGLLLFHIYLSFLPMVFYIIGEFNEFEHLIDIFISADHTSNGYILNSLSDNYLLSVPLRYFGHDVCHLFVFKMEESLMPGFYFIVIGRF